MHNNYALLVGKAGGICFSLSMTIISEVYSTATVRLFEIYLGVLYTEKQ